MVTVKVWVSMMMSLATVKVWVSMMMSLANERTGAFLIDNILTDAEWQRVGQLLSQKNSFRIHEFRWVEVEKVALTRWSVVDDMTFDQSFYGDVAKLILQLAVSLVVAWLAVRWALGRFKKEKLWERRVEAYADVVAALGAMRLIIGRWADEMEGLRNYSDEAKQAFNDEYRSAKRRFEQAVAVAQLILPQESATALEGLARQLEADDGTDPFDAINAKYGIIDDGLCVLVAQGRIELR
jgi:hypothetical protein